MKMNVYRLSTLLFLPVLIQGTSPLDKSPPRIPPPMSPPQPDCPPTVCPPDCVRKELFIGPQKNGCIICHCDPNDTSILSPPQPVCPPPVCPQDCGTELFIDPQNGCMTCRCDPNDTSNQCVDKVPNCQDFLSWCVPMRHICQKTCGLCEEVSPPQPDCPPPVCPEDCGVDLPDLFIDPQNECMTCRCDPNDTSNQPVFPKVPIIGGIGEVKPANSEIQILLEKVIEEVERELGRTLDTFKVISYAEQVVEGFMIHAKVQISSQPDEYIHIRVIDQPWNNIFKLHDVKENKTLADGF